MNWFYVLNGYRAGPVPADELAQLLLHRTISPATLVWREGMKDWEPLAEVDSAETVLPRSLACSQCGGAFPPDQVIAMGTGVICAKCKPAAIEKLREGIPLENGVISLRRQYLGQETSLRSGGVLFLLLGAILSILGVLWFTNSWPAATSALPRNSSTVPLGMAVVAIGGFLFVTGLALRQLRPSARIPSIVFAAVGLLVIPFGTLIGAYLLYLLFSKRGRFILSTDYRLIVAATPQIKYRVSVFTWVALGILFLAFVAFLVWMASE